MRIVDLNRRQARRLTPGCSRGRGPSAEVAALVYDGRGPEGQQKHAVRAYPKKRPSAQAVHRWWYRQLEAAGLVGRGSRTDRKCTRLATPSQPSCAASQALSRADLNTTLGIYGHRDHTDLEVAMEAYARWLEQ